MDVFIWIGLLFVLGLGYREGVALLFATTLVLAMMIWQLLKGKSFVYPKLLLEYFIFLALFLVSIWWSKDQLKSISHWLIFASMPMVWVFAYSRKEWVKKHFFTIFVSLGVMFLAMTVLTQFFPQLSFLKTTPRGLVGAYSMNADHFMLGDFWSVLLIVLIYRYFQTKNTWLLPLVSLGMAVMLFSLSRSALVGFVVSLSVYFACSPQVSVSWKRFFWLFVGLALLYMSTQKSFLFNRPYYLQVLMGFFTYPFGVGVGNFDFISADERFHVLGLSGFSRVTHSVLLEFIAGMGIIGTYFWWWCYRASRLVSRYFSINDYSLALVALTVDFVFNPTYFVVPMWWLFGVLLALIIEDGERKSSIASGGILVTAGLFLVLGLLTLTIF